MLSFQPHGILEEGSQELKAGRCGSLGSRLAATHGKAPVLERVKFNITERKEKKKKRSVG